MWDLIVSVPDHCLFFHFSSFDKAHCHRALTVKVKRSFALIKEHPSYNDLLFVRRGVL